MSEFMDVAARFREATEPEEIEKLGNEMGRRIFPETLPALREDTHGIIPHTGTPLPSLYEVEDTLAALLESEETVTPEQEAEFKLDLAQQMKLAVRKRDAVAGFIVECENRAEFADQEIKRLKTRRAMFQRAADRLSGYVLSIIEQLPQAKGKPQKLEGERFQMAARACPASVEITDAALVPLKYKRVTVTMPAEQWKGLLVAAGVLIHSDIRTPEYSIDKAMLKADLQGVEVPGADLIVDKHYLKVS